MPVWIWRKFLVVPLVLLSLSLILTACDGNTPKFANADLSKNYNQGEAIDKTTAFSTSDKVIHCVLRLSGDINGAKVKLVWIAVDTADGAKNKTLLEKEFTAFIDLDVYDNTLPAPENGKFATGKYKVELHLNTRLDRTLEFTVQ